MKKETEFKVLMHSGQYVDANMLQGGIYFCDKPFIYSKHETIGTMLAKGYDLMQKAELFFISNEYFENLKQCELVPVIISTDEPKTIQEVPNWVIQNALRCPADLQISIAAKLLSHLDREQLEEAFSKTGVAWQQCLLQEEYKKGSYNASKARDSFDYLAE